MKIVRVLFLLLPVHVWAQPADTLKHSISLWGESSAMFNSGSSMSTAGFQYQIRKSKHFSYHLSAGYANYNNITSDGLLLIASDTAIKRRITDNINLGMVGFGVETERQFYHRLYFFAGLEVRVGYGSGTADTSFASEYNAPIAKSYTTVIVGPESTVSGSETMTYVGFSPYFGLKLAFRKWELGTSFMNYVNLKIISQKGGSSNGSLDFDSNNLTQRVFVSYKF